MHDEQSHSSNFMNLLECLHDQSHVSSPHRLPHICLSRMRVKSHFSKQKLFVIENTLPSFGKILDNPPRRICWITFRNNSWAPPTCIVGQSPNTILRKIFRRNSFHKHFHFCFISCYALTTNILGCLSAYGMHDANSNTFMLIYSHAYILTYFNHIKHVM